MSTTSSDDLRQIATDLLTLTGWSIGDLARVAELHRPNLVSWLGGKPQVMAEVKQLKVLEILGWHYGRLRRDVVHRWVIGSDFSLARTVLLRHGIATGNDLEIQPAFGTGSGVFGGALLISRDDQQNPLIVLVKRKLGREWLDPIAADSLGIGVFNECPFEVSAAVDQAWWQAEPAPDRQFPTRYFLQECAEQWRQGRTALEDQLGLLATGPTSQMQEVAAEENAQALEQPASSHSEKKLEQPRVHGGSKSYDETGRTG